MPRADAECGATVGRRRRQSNIGFPLGFFVANLLHQANSSPQTTNQHESLAAFIPVRTYSRPGGPRTGPGAGCFLLDGTHRDR